MAALVVAGVAQMASGQITPPSPTGPAGLYLVNGVSQIFVALSGGVASYSGAVGSYGVAIAGGVELAGGASPILDLDVTTTSVGSGNLYIFFTDGAFGPTSGAPYSLFTSQFNTVSGGTASTWVYQNSTQLGGKADSTSGPVVNATGVLSGSSYYLTLEDVINGSVTSADSTFTSSAVPEANTLVAGALMLLPLGIGAVRAIRKERVA